jgi:arginyl-tRNA synthetase
MNLRRMIEDRLREALVRCGAPADSPAVVSPSPRSEFGDYQASGAMSAGKRLKINPRQLAQKVADLLAAPAEKPQAAACEAPLAIADIAEKVEIAGPGFINIFLKADFLQSRLSAAAGDDRLGAESADRPQTVVVDYSAPNLAKEMHVGHLRSTIIGDALARVLAFLGHDVVRQNHVGDWGTQFGMLMAYCDDALGGFARPAAPGGEAALFEASGIADMEEFYRRAKARFDADAAFQDKARGFVVRLQGGDPAVRRLWGIVVRESLSFAERVYRRLGVLLTDADVRGESAYNDALPKVIDVLREKGLIAESQGAQCVFLDEFKGKDDEPLPFIVQKSDEGYLYATTDLAAVWFRCGRGRAEGAVPWVADRVLYVVDARQSLHFRMLFAVARKAGFAPPGAALEHVPFGTVMGANGKPFKTREGGTVKLMDLLEEGVRKALDLVGRKNAEDVEKGRSEPLTDGQKRKIAETIGIGAVKYADLCQNRASDYVFSFEKMLSLDGNTAPYMQYAYARICSIFRKGSPRGEDVPPSRAAGMGPQDLGGEPLAVEPRFAAADGSVASASGVAVPPASSSRAAFSLAHPSERALAVKLLQFPETVDAVAEQCLPNILCGYLYELAGLFMGFYENCPVLQSDEPVRGSRLALCDLAARVIRQGLELLGIGTIERM